MSAGTISASGGTILLISNVVECGNHRWLSVLAVIDATVMGATARTEICLSIASWANTMPAIGALKPAEIAAATPQPK